MGGWVERWTEGLGRWMDLVMGLHERENGTLGFSTAS